MTLLRSKTSEVMNQGRAKRGKWKVDPDAAHYKNYRWWLDHGGDAPVTENFCHYWRVVAVWVPLQKLKLRLSSDTTKQVLWTIAALVAVIGVAVATILATDTVLGALYGVLGVLMAAAFLIYVKYSFKTAFFVYEKVTGDDSKSWAWKWLDGKPLSVVVLCAVLSLPMLIIVGIGLVLLFTFAELILEREVHRWFIDTTIRGISWLTPVTIFAASCVAYLVSTAWLLPVPEALARASRDLLQSIGILAALAAVVLGFALLMVGIDELKKYLHDRRVMKRAKARRERSGDFLRSIFVILHPEYAGHERRFAEWANDLVREASFFDLDDLYGSSPLTILDSLPEEWLRKVLDYFGFDDMDDLYDNESRVFAAVAPSSSVVTVPRKRPVSTGIKVVADFTRLLWAYVVTKKWRICPVVELPE